MILSCYAAKVLGIQAVALISVMKAKVTCGQCSHYLLTLVLKLAARRRYRRRTRFRRRKSILFVCQKEFAHGTMFIYCTTITSGNTIRVILGRNLVKE
jgi:hypothetical protein